MNVPRFVSLRGHWYGGRVATLQCLAIFFTTNKIWCYGSLVEPDIYIYSDESPKSYLLIGNLTGENNSDRSATRVWNGPYRRLRGDLQN